MSDIDKILSASLPSNAIRENSLLDGDRAFRQGDRAMGLFFLVSGRIDLLRWTETGTAVRLHIGSPGHTFAEASLFADYHHCDGVSVSESNVRCYERSAVLSAFDNDPTFARTLCAHLAHSLVDARRLIELRAVTPLSQRLLLRLHERVGKDGKLPHGTTIKSIASEIGATSEATYRALAALEKSGRIVRDRRNGVRLIKAD